MVWPSLSWHGEMRCDAYVYLYRGNKMQSCSKTDRWERHAQILFAPKGKTCNNELTQPWTAAANLSRHYPPSPAGMRPKLQRGRRKATKSRNSSCLKESFPAKLFRPLSPPVNGAGQFRRASQYVISCERTRAAGFKAIGHDEISIIQAMMSPCEFYSMRPSLSFS